MKFNVEFLVLRLHYCNVNLVEDANPTGNVSSNTVSEKKNTELADLGALIRRPPRANGEIKLLDSSFSSIAIVFW